MNDGNIDVYQVFPVLTVTDLEPAIAFYRDALGFDLAWSWGEPPVRVGVRLGKVELQLVCDPHVERSGPSVVYCHMHGVDAYFEACRRRGVEFALELGSRPWGARDFRVIDPSGNRLGFAEVTS
jgi:uncharacterized glyoxalase superfamily protein PhnB